MDNVGDMEHRKNNTPVVVSQVSLHLRLLNLYHSLGIFSRRQIDDIFLIFVVKRLENLHSD